MNMKLYLPTFLIATTGLFLPSCDNPADGVAKAQDVAEDVAATPDGAGQVYVFAADSKIEFVGSKVTGSHEGGFTKFEGQFKTDGEKLLGGENAITIDMSSTWSDNEKLTGHLLSPDFFDAEKFPTSTFKLLKTEAAEGDNQYLLTGEFTLHGVSKTIGIPAKVWKEADKAYLTSEFAINRQDYGISYPGKTDDLIRDEVVIKLDMVATPQA